MSFVFKSRIELLKLYKDQEKTSKDLNYYLNIYNLSPIKSNKIDLNLPQNILCSGYAKILLLSRKKSIHKPIFKKKGFRWAQNSIHYKIM